MFLINNLDPDSLFLLDDGINTNVSVTMNMMNTCKYKSPEKIFPLSFRKYIQLPYGHHPLVALDTFNTICPKCSQVQKPTLPLLPKNLLFLFCLPPFSVRSITLQLLIKARNLEESLTPLLITMSNHEILILPRNNFFNLSISLHLHCFRSPFL